MKVYKSISDTNFATWPFLDRPLEREGSCTVAT